MYDQLLITHRRGDTTVTGRNLFEETLSDKSRVVFSSSIRRLQQKAQVFSLETNASVRSRLTHSLEVADYGRWIAYKITDQLVDKGWLNPEKKIPFINIVETACILHDIGNLPFGHFGESAVQEWFEKYWKEYYKNALGINETEEIGTTSIIFRLINDFTEFDGNPQGFRIITILQQPPRKFNGTGLNLIVPQIYAFLKYLRVADGNKNGKGIMKKAGYFNSEEYIVKEIQDLTGISKRFPLTYIMEAADDISYCLSDIEDGIEKGIIAIDEFFKELKIQWEKLANTQTFPFGLVLNEAIPLDEQFFLFKTNLARKLIDIAANAYVDRHNEILKGETGQLFDSTSEAHLFLEALKNVARKKLFRSREAENNELAGHSIIYGLLEKFSPLLSLSKGDFDCLLAFKDDPSVMKGKKLDIELRLFNRLPSKYVKAYQFGLEKNKFGQPDDPTLEWFYRAHLIVDFISGMTDLFALNLYRLLHGIQI